MGVPNTYVTLWTKHRCAWLRRVRDHGPLCVLFGGPHTSLPSLGHVRVGDTIFPVCISEGKLLVIARMRVGQLVTLAEYARDYLHLDIDPQRLAVALLTHDFANQNPLLGHRAPAGCVNQVAIGVDGTAFNFERSVAPEDLPGLTFGPKAGSEKPLRGVKDGRLLQSISLQGHVRRASEDSSKILASVCGN